MTLLRNRYRVNLVGLQHACDANYVRLMKLLPEMRQVGYSRRVALSDGDRLLGVLTLQVLEVNPYTTTLQLLQEHSLPWLPWPRLQIRVYHDARMAEVVVANNACCLRGLYAYPNEAMHQPDEKAQLNLFLGEWLNHCLARGHALQSVN